MLYFIDVYGNFTAVSKGLVIALLAIAAAFVVGFYVLRSIGVYVLCKRENVKLKFLSFIPVGWIYVLCKAAGKVKFFGAKFDAFAIVTLSVYFLSFASMLFTNLCIYIPLAGYYFQGGEVFLATTMQYVPIGAMPYMSGVFVGQDMIIPYSDAFSNAINVMSYVENIVSIIYIFFEVTLFVSVFRKYWPQHYLLASILSVFGFFGPFIFGVRNHKAVNYSDYVKQRYASFYMNGTGNPYNNGNSNSNFTDSPFNEYSDKKEENKESTNDSGDPFSEFSGEDKKDDGKGGN